MIVYQKGDLMYQALARKYRPQVWAEVIGQSHVTRTLANAVSSNRLHHAYLFCGARGVGKTTVARILAKVINCTGRGESVDPCNECTSCLEITAGRSLDVHEIDGASNTGVDDVREIREQLKYLPSGERSKIYIVDEVHMLSKAAFNALLKTLEEPPPHVVFIFATTEPQKIPVTILSRCQRYDFRLVGTVPLVETLRSIASQEGIEVGDDVLHLLAFEAGGSLRDAESLFDQAIAFAGKLIDCEAVRDMLGLIDRKIVWRVLDAVCNRDVKEALSAVSSVIQAGGNLPRLAQELLELFRHLWVLRSCGHLSNADELSAEEKSRLKELQQRVTLEECQQWFTIVAQGVDDLVRAQFPKLTVEAMILQLVQITPLTSLSELMSRVETLMVGNNVDGVGVKHSTNPTAEAKVDRASKQMTGKTDGTVAKISASSLGSVSHMPWAELASKLRVEQPRLASLLDNAKINQTDNEKIEIIFPKKSIYADLLSEASRSQQLKDFLRKYWGADANFVLARSEGPSGAELRAVALANSKSKEQAATKAAHDHATVKAAQQILGAEVREVKLYDKST